MAQGPKKNLRKGESLRKGEGIFQKKGMSGGFFESRCRRVFKNGGGGLGYLEYCTTNCRLCAALPVTDRPSPEFASGFQPGGRFRIDIEIRNITITIIEKSSK